MLRSANLESRQSKVKAKAGQAVDAPLREFGIKAKLGFGSRPKRDRCSAPRIWNQGKADLREGDGQHEMLRSANLESRQSAPEKVESAVPDAPLREFGIKAKPQARMTNSRNRCSAPRIWNQGKAASHGGFTTARMLRSANLESRQSAALISAASDRDAPLREFGIKAKQ